MTIKVSDEGGGIPRSGMPNIWTYLYSTANHPVEMEIQVRGVRCGLGSAHTGTAVTHLFYIYVYTVYILYFGREITKYTVVHGVYIRCWPTLRM